jgi:hypothetical protein
MMRMKQAERRVLPLLLGMWLFLGSAAAAELPQVVILATGGTIAGELKKPGEGGFEICIDGLSIWLMRIAREIGRGTSVQAVWE